MCGKSGNVIISVSSIDHTIKVSVLTEKFVLSIARSIIIFIQRP